MSEYYIGALAFSDSNYLAHHGVKGMKWGVRKFEEGKINNRRRFAKQLNKNERKIAKLKTKLAIQKIKHPEKEDKIKDYEDAIKKGNDSISKILKSASAKNISIGSAEKSRYTHFGRHLLANALAGPVGNMVVGGVDIYRAKNYGSEAGGVVKGKKYYARKN